MELEHEAFIKWHDRLWNKAKTLESYWIYGYNTEHDDIWSYTEGKI
jgi:hypothetical protein